MSRILKETQESRKVYQHSICQSRFPSVVFPLLDRDWSSNVFFFFFFHKNVQFYYLKQGCIKGSPPHRHWTKTACCNAPLAHGRRSWIFHPTSGTSHGINSLHFKVSFQIIPILLSQIQSIYLSVHHPPTLGLPKSVTQFT